MMDFDAARKKITWLTYSEVESTTQEIASVLYDLLEEVERYSRINHDGDGWFAKLPTVAGLYWWRTGPDDKDPGLIRLDFDSRGIAYWSEPGVERDVLPKGYERYFWSGPVKPPPVKP